MRQGVSKPEPNKRPIQLEKGLSWPKVSVKAASIRY